jgi:hypothetical protein
VNYFEEYFEEHSASFQRSSEVNITSKAREFFRKELSEKQLV